MPRRMRVRLFLLAAGCRLRPSLLWSLLPVGSSARPDAGADPEEDRPQQLADRRPQGARAGPDERHLEPDAPDQHAAVGHHAPRRRASRSCRRASTPSATELAAVQRRLRQERARLTRLRARLIVVRRALAARLVELYKADPPDVVTVVLESDGFADLRQPHRVHDQGLQAGREDHGHRVRGQGGRDRDRGAPGPAREAREARSRRRSSPSATRSRPCASASSTAATGSQNARSTKFALLRSSRDRRHELEDDVEELRDAQAKVQARLAGFSGPVSAGPIKPGSGGLIWPVNGPITSPFCESRSWESCHPGIDIGVPAGTPIRAAAAGKVVLMQSAGVVRRLRQLHLHPARRRAVDVLRAPVALRHVAGRERRRRARSSATLGAPAAASGITCTSRPGSTGPW